MKSKFLAGPYIAWMVIFTVVPLGMVVYFAFSGTDGGFSLENFTHAAEYFPTFLRSVWYALVACAICLVIGYPVAYVIAQSTASVQRVLYLLVTLPMCMSFLLRTLAWVALLRDTGIINTILGFFGIGPFPLIRNAGSVILGMVYNYLPYMIMPLYTVIAKLDPRLIEGRTGSRLRQCADLPPGHTASERARHSLRHHHGVRARGEYLLYHPAAGRHGQYDDRRYHRAPVQGHSQPEPRRCDEPHPHGAGVHLNRPDEQVHGR